MSCPDCFRGGVHEGDPVGSTTTIHGLPVYVSNPPEGATPKGIVVFIPDAFGWEFGNNRLLADKYAKRAGVVVYLPDFMAGSAMPLSGLDLLDKIMTPTSWLNTILYKPFYILQAMTQAIPFIFKNRLSVTKPRVSSFIQALRTSPPPFPTTNLKIGAAGFCWGGKHTMLLAQDPPSSRVSPYSSTSTSLPLSPLIDCAFTAHPSMISVPADIEQITVPTSVAVGDVDMAMGKKDILTMKEILEVKKKGDHEVVLLDGAKHGFAVRTMDDKHQWECAAKAETQAVQWFGRWFA
ncbi:alpha/beta-hydrolase [Mollisia scopiformis]|uniref:Alpha/beta-hydrolase n=1 Tax=Mollisia scopiformis TaxID=149040 RepID=A0A194XCZ3_MOLSC|nr:alpha/beta-hydrolase [Mollisia scopiformis]KUJ18045.1 alpha/beta-hydrolase [Mollisia scopiformis]